MCEYCDGHWHQDGNEVRNTHILISGDRFVINQQGLELYTVINYCPMCGRNLKEDDDGND